MLGTTTQIGRIEVVIESNGATQLRRRPSGENPSARIVCGFKRGMKDSIDHALSYVNANKKECQRILTFLSKI